MEIGAQSRVPESCAGGDSTYIAFLNGGEGRGAARYSGVMLLQVDGLPGAAGGRAFPAVAFCCDGSCTFVHMYVCTVHTGVGQGEASRRPDSPGLPEKT